MLSFDTNPPSPNRPREEVLDAVLRRGRTLRRRRQIARHAPAGLAVLLVLAVGAAVVLPSDPARDRVRVTADDRRDQGDTGQGLQTDGAEGPVGGEGDAGRRTNPGPGRPRDDGPPIAGAPGPRGDGGGSPGGPGTGGAAVGTRRGNLVGASEGERGCEVHNIGAAVNDGQGNDIYNQWWCTYDAVKPGGYIADGPFLEMRITRGEQVIVIDGRTAPRCRPIGFIQPGDEVYVDGRTRDASQPYTTTRVGDRFGC